MRQGSYAVVAGLYPQMVVTVERQTAIVLNGRPLPPASVPAPVPAPPPAPPPAATHSAAPASLLVRFADHSARIEPGAFDATAVRAAGPARVTVTGYADMASLTRAGSQLARARALSVRRALVAAGVDPAVVKVRYHGARQLLVEGVDQAARAQSGRVEVTVEPMRLVHS